MESGAGHQEEIGSLLAEFPYVHALHMVQPEWSHDRQGIFSHPLWDKEHLIAPPAQEIDKETSTEVSQTATIREPREPVEPVEPEEEKDSENSGDDEERISVYHDEHLPYSFLWWLNKTRLDYAHTYTPYASSGRNTGKAPRNPTFPSLDPKENEVLDQQIRENIFYLQDPEEKLSDHTTSPIPFQVPKKSDPVIERFIQEEPKISPPRPEKLSFENKARKSASDQGTVVTETLAKIYEEQGLYPKALEVYEKLSLKFPEKSAYFADRIEDLKNKLT